MAASKSPKISFLSLCNLKAPRGVSPLCKLHRYVRPPRVPPPGTKAANIFIKERGGEGGGAYGPRQVTTENVKCTAYDPVSRSDVRLAKALFLELTSFIPAFL